MMQRKKVRTEMKNIFKKLHIGTNHETPPSSSSSSITSQSGVSHLHATPVQSSATCMPSPTSSSSSSPSPSSAAESTSTFIPAKSNLEDYFSSEEEFQVQLALAISASNSEFPNDPEKDQIREATFLSLGGSHPTHYVTNKNTEAEALSRHYWEYNVLDYEERVEDGFYDVYSLCNDAVMQKKMPSLADIEGNPGSCNFEIVVVNRKIDAVLEELLQIAQCIALDCPVSKVGVLVQRLAELVMGHMGGPVKDANIALAKWMERSRELRTSLHTCVLPLGSINIGLSRHRALLFKVLADNIKMPCRLVKGSHYTGVEDDAVNIIKLDAEREFLVDLMAAPGTLIPADLSAKDTAFKPYKANILPSLQSSMESGFSYSRQTPSDGEGSSQISKMPDRATSSLQEKLPSSAGTLLYKGTLGMNAIGEGTRLNANIVPYSHDSLDNSRSLFADINPFQINGTGKASVHNKLMENKSPELRVMRDDSVSGQPPVPLMWKNRNAYNDIPRKINHDPSENSSQSSHDFNMRKDINIPDLIEFTDSALAPSASKVNRVEDLKQDCNKRNGGGFENDTVGVANNEIKFHDRRKCTHDRFMRNNLTLEASERPSSSIDSTAIGGDQILDDADVGKCEIPWEDLIIGERIGIGSYGEVFRADWNGTEVAVKKFLDQDFSGAALAEFKGEVRIMRRLCHPNIVLFMGAVTRPPNLSIISEFIPRGSLYKILHRPNCHIDEKRRIKMALDVARGMNCLHTSTPTIVHRDLKSPNLLVDNNWNVKSYQIGIRAGFISMVTTRSSQHDPGEGTSLGPDPLAAIASRLETLDELRDKVAALEVQSKNNEKKKSRIGRWADECEEEERQFHRLRPPQAKIEFPKFKGGDPRGWILQEEKFFRYYATPDDDKVDIASMYLEDEALDLFSWLNSDRTILYWEDLVKALEEHFGPPEYQNPDEHLSTIRQEGTVAEYRHEWSRRVARVTNWPEHCLLGVFMGGLKEELKTKVRIHKPRTVFRASSLALEFEKEVEQTHGYKSGTKKGPIRPNPFYPNSHAYSAREQKGGITASLEISKPSSSTSNPSFSVNASSVPYPMGESRPNSNSEVERQRRRDKGLCFRCGMQFRPGHRCNRNFSLMEIVDEEEEIVSPVAEEEDAENVGPLAEISFNAIVGRSSASTMKLEGEIQGRRVLILIDSGSTHNFISQALVSDLKLPVEKLPIFGVQIGDGRMVRCSQICKNVEVKISDLNINQDFYPFTLRGSELVLGVKWLASLNTIEANWNKMFMVFWMNGKKYKLQGIPSKTKTYVCLQSMLLETEERVADLQIKGVCEEFSSIFDEPTSLPPSRNHFHTITLLPNSPPPNIRPYRYPHYQKDELESQIAALLERGFIRPSISPYASPVLLVSKKDGSWRLCVDYRRLNKITVPDKYPIPNIDELLDELNGSVYFSKIDLRSGYHQIRVLPSDIEKTAFRTHSGHYEFVVMPFGLTNAPATFQAVMNDLFRPYLRKFVLVFFDDILVYSSSSQEHIEHLRTVFQILKQHCFFANEKKCSLGKAKIEYLGHIVSAKGVEVVPEKIMGVIQWPTPKTIKELRGFLGLTNYYRRFVKDYGIIARPLTDLTKKDAFFWSEKAQDAFEMLKEALTTTPVLQLPNFHLPFTVECDASMSGVGAVLMQNGHPIAYFSKGLSFSNRYKSAYDRELLALVLSLQKWRHYLLGRPFQVQTDHYSLKHLLDQRIITPSQQRLMVKLLPFDFTIHYKSGKNNAAADSLSRKPEQVEFFHLVIPMVKDIQQLPQELLKDDETRKIIEELQQHPNPFSNYSVVNGRLYYHTRLVIPKNSPLRQQLLEEAHATPIGGHGGFLKTLKRLSEKLYWKGMKNDVKRFVQTCQICQRNKYQTLAPAGLLQPLPIPERIWEDISIDFITGLPKSRGYDVILVVVDRLSKYSHFIALTHPFSAKTVAEKFCQDIVRLHGMPRSIVSNRDSIFLSTFWQELFRLSHTRLNMSTAYHPQTDGQTEVMNRCLETYLRCFASDQPKKWSKFLCWAEFSFNTSFQVAAATTPFKLVYGREPPSIIPYVKGETLVADLEDQLEERDAMIKLLKDNLMKAQNRMKQQADQHRRDVQFKAGDVVWLRLQPYRQQSLTKRRFEKLSPRFFGPYKILKKVGQVAYELELPSNTTIHPVFHVSLLRPAPGQSVCTPLAPLPLTNNMELVLNPIKVLQHRWLNTQQLELLIQWDKRPIEDATWEDYDLFSKQFPKFQLEDKLAFQGGSIDKPYLTYSRRKKHAAPPLE